MGTSNKDGITKPISMDNKKPDVIVSNGFVTIPMKWLKGFGTKRGK